MDLIHPMGRIRSSSRGATQLGVQRLVVTKVANYPNLGVVLSAPLYEHVSRRNLMILTVIR